MNAIPKVVFFRTLKTTDRWPETLIASGDTPEEIAKLKADPSKDLVAAGGTEFMHSLIKLGVSTVPAVDCAGPSPARARRWSPSWMRR